MHIAWINWIRGVIEALDDAQGYLIPQVCIQLPLAVCLALPNPTAPVTWETFLQSITSLPADRIHDQQESIAWTKTPPSLTMALTSRFRNQTHIPYHQPPSTYFNPGCQPPNAPTFNIPTSATPATQTQEEPPHIPYTDLLPPQTLQTCFNTTTPNLFLTHL
jgi:hypothetical protein